MISCDSQNYVVSYFGEICCIERCDNMRYCGKNYCVGNLCIYK